VQMEWLLADLEQPPHDKDDRDHCAEAGDGGEVRNVYHPRSVYRTNSLKSVENAAGHVPSSRAKVRRR
jgi:hypothetical protein